MAYQSLYRRYRPRRFSDVRGQEHVVRALRNAVRESHVGHAYLFTGPRGTGKTSTARILAKALNCENLQDGEPDGTCESCLAIDGGTSYDVQELDAASNNGVSDVRDLIGRVNLGSPGRTKVYILDEVHMLTAQASAALLKTLEEPPGHVVFVLATTDPQKVLPTIKSRTQQYDFHLVAADVLAEHVQWVMHDAGLDLGEDVVDHVVRLGAGSVRDTLSALDQVAAAGGVIDDSDSLADLLDAVAAGDAGRCLVAVADAVASGRDPRVLGETLLARLRDVFLVRMGASTDHLPTGDVDQVRAWADQLGDRATTRALEAVGDALLEMRQAPDPRIPLEVALVKITRVDAGGIDALAERVARLEAAIAGGVPAAAAPAGAAGAAPAGAAPAGSGHAAPSGSPSGAPARPSSGAAAGERPAPPAPPGRSGGAASARAALAASRAKTSSSTPAPPAAAPPTPAPPADPSATAGAPPVPPAPPAPDSGQSVDPGATAGAPPVPSAPAPGQSADPGATAGAPPVPSAPAPGQSADPGATAGAPLVPPTGSPAPAPGSSADPGASATGAPSVPAAASAPTEPSASAGSASQPAGGAGDPASSSAAAGGSLDRGRLESTWTDTVLPNLRGLTKAMYSVGRFTGLDGATAVLALPNEVHRQKCEQKRPEVEAALSDALGSALTLRLVVDDDPGSAPSSTGGSSGRTPEPEEDLAGVDVHDLEDAPDAPAGGIQALTEAFPGAELIEGD